MKTQLKPFSPKLAAVLGTGRSQKRYISVSRSAATSGCAASDLKPVIKAPVILARIEAALDRLDLGTFGLCTDCGDEICLTRLDHDPSVPNCQVCANDAAL